MIKTIQFRKSDHDLFLIFWKQLEQKFSRFKNVVVENTNDEILLKFEIQSSNAKTYSKLIKLWLCDSMVVYYKEKYLLSHMKIAGLDNLPFKLIVKAITIFDKSQDVASLYDKIETGTTDINVHSFYVFKMGELRQRWQEICELFSNNIRLMGHSEVLIELIRYLILVTESERRVVEIDIEENDICIKDENGTLLVEPIRLNEEGGSINVILHLISFAPKTIAIKFDKEKNPKLADFVENLFAGKVIYNT